MTLIDEKECHLKFGQYVRSTRKKEKISQHELAEKIAVAQPQISYIERGIREVDLALAIRICEALNRDIRDFANKCL